MRLSLRSWLLWVALICVLLVPLAGIIGAARTALIAEEHLQAMFRAVVATQEFVEHNPGDWPASWQELRPYFPPETDVDWVAESVDFDFTADPAELATQTWESFAGIRPHEPCFEAYENRLIVLIAQLRDQHLEATENQSPRL